MRSGRREIMKRGKASGELRGQPVTKLTKSMEEGKEGTYTQEEGGENISLYPGRTTNTPPEQNSATNSSSRTQPASLGS